MAKGGVTKVNNNRDLSDAIRVWPSMARLKTMQEGNYIYKPCQKKKQYSDLLKEATIQEIVGLFMVAGWEGGRAFGWAFSSELNHRLEI